MRPASVVFLLSMETNNSTLAHRLVSDRARMVAFASHVSSDRVREIGYLGAMEQGRGQLDGNCREQEHQVHREFLERVVDQRVVEPPYQDGGYGR